ncbi:hypothetical protein [Sphingomonas sp.]|uniref:hypothetical protein n=1 Tax=Sphingomonas sp. TaxID=28214 RepID=UPI001ED5C241|nr:hypothetical protein [Sphingomonas sp.]MBX3593453.1 hypothetical protein [Sphingomonas sp.]
MVTPLVLLLALGAQTATPQVPAESAAPQAPAESADVVYDEIVVEAKVGRVALIFDRAADGRLINCRVFVSSGVKKLDDSACNSLPECITSTAGRKYCGGDGTQGLVAVEPKTLPAQPAPELGLGKLLKPDPPRTPAVGPSIGKQDAEDANRMRKLPPPPRDESGSGPAITFGSGQTDGPK